MKGPSDSSRFAAGMPLEPLFVLAALVLEACVGYPAKLQRWLPHPVVGLGRIIEALELRWNSETPLQLSHDQRVRMQRRVLGLLTVVIVTAVAAGIGAALVVVCESSMFGWVALVICATPGLAQRSLYQHVAAVVQPLEAGNLHAARTTVAMIVGRDTGGLDESGVATAAIESLAESFNDGIVAPAFWLLVGGLPGLFAYKAINTADSLIGHMEPRWREFGWAAARTDDWANWIPARIAGLLIAAAAGRGFGIMLRDARKHASPNAGWPEAAMAGALALRLGGPASYDGQTHVRPWFGDGSRAAPSDLRAAVSLYVRACVALWILLAVMAAALRLTNAQ